MTKFEICRKVWLDSRRGDDCKIWIDVYVKYENYMQCRCENKFCGHELAKHEFDNGRCMRCECEKFNEDEFGLEIERMRNNEDLG